MFDLNTLWFILIAILWTGFFFLEGFDFGVGMLLPFLGKKDEQRRAIINTIGPHWDGNEVWLIDCWRGDFCRFSPMVCHHVQRILPGIVPVTGGIDHPRRCL